MRGWNLKQILVFAGMFLFALALLYLVFLKARILFRF